MGDGGRHLHGEVRRRDHHVHGRRHVDGRIAASAGPGGPRVLDGTSCVCVVGSAAGVDYDTERVVR